LEPRLRFAKKYPVHRPSGQHVEARLNRDCFDSANGANPQLPESPLISPTLATTCCSYFQISLDSPLIRGCRDNIVRNSVNHSTTTTIGAWNNLPPWRALRSSKEWQPIYLVVKGSGSLYECLNGLDSAQRLRYASPNAQSPLVRPYRSN
jgi:hypothetical protein